MIGVSRRAIQWKDEGVVVTRYCADPTGPAMIRAPNVQSPLAGDSA